MSTPKISETVRELEQALGRHDALVRAAARVSESFSGYCLDDEPLESLRACVDELTALAYDIDDTGRAEHRLALCEHFRRGRRAHEAETLVLATIDGELASTLDAFERRDLRLFQPLAVDRQRGRCFLGGQPVPDGARLELATEAGALPVQHYWGSGDRNHPFAMLEIDSMSADRIPVELRLYDGMLARLAHAAEGRRD